MLEIVSGQGSSSQREAYRQLVRLPSWADLPRKDKYALILAHATEIQRRASIASALSGWGRVARAGRNPSAAQWLAFSGLPEEVQVSVIHAIDNGTADTVWRISDMEFNGSKIGKQLLMGTNWSGYFSLDDEQAMRRFAAYVMR